MSSAGYIIIVTDIAVTDAAAAMPEESIKRPSLGPGVENFFTLVFDDAARRAICCDWWLSVSAGWVISSRPYGS